MGSNVRCVGNAGIVGILGILGILAILAHATPAFSPVKRIQGKVVEEQGQPVLGATSALRRRHQL
jgi:hypothetical protein